MIDHALPTTRYCIRYFGSDETADVFIQITIMRPPNYTLLMIWVPVILLASIVGYLKRENLYMLYDTRYWAVAAMVRLK